MESLRKIVRDVLRESVIEETQTGQKDLEKFTNDVLKLIADAILKEKAHLIWLTGNEKEPITNIPLVNTLMMNGDDFSEIGKFVGSTNIRIVPTSISIRGNKNTKGELEYGPPNNFNEEYYKIWLKFSKSDLEEINDIFNKDGREVTTTDIYFKLFYIFYSTLLHELQHAYDAWRSKGKSFGGQLKKSYTSDQEKANMLMRTKSGYDEMTPEEIEAINKSRVAYLNLVHEINARYAQAMQKIVLTGMDYETFDDIKEDWNKVYRDFKSNFEGWRHLSDKMKKRLTRRLAKAYQEAIENLKTGSEKYSKEDLEMVAEDSAPKKLDYRIEHMGAHHGQEDLELGLYIDDEIIGMVQYTLYDGELTIRDIIVRPEFRRQGFGSKMMKYIKKQHPEYKYVPSMMTDLGAKFVHKDVDISEVRKIVRSILSEIENSDEYRGAHVMHKDSSSSPLHNLLQSGQVAKDFYENIHHYAYLHNKSDQESVNIIKQARNKPDATVVIYRAVPKGVSDINPGDWISLSKSYAKHHGLHHEDPKLNMPVISKKVKAKDIWWDGNDVNEFSYFPEGLSEGSIIRESKLDSKKMKKVIRTDYALLDILDSTEASGSDWGAGGCWILADALSEYYDAPLYVAYNSEMNRIEHFMIKIGDLFMDGDGLRKGVQIIKDMKEDGVYIKDINNLLILPYSSDMNSDIIVRDLDASKKLVDLFRRSEKNIVNESLMQEFITNDEVYLKQYLSMSDDSKKSMLPHEFSYFFNDFIEESGIEFTWPKHMVKSNYEDEPEVEEDMFDSEIELITWIENNNKELYDAFANYLFKKIKDNTLPINDSEYPAWSYFDDTPQLIKNQWLIHFTDNADDVAREGFKFGVDDMTRLGLTTSLGEFDKKYGGFNFAYLISDFPRYSRRSYTQGGGYKYGKEAVVFMASGIKTWHHGDEEPQVIFYGNTATNIIPIKSGENAQWAVYSGNGRILFENDDLERVVGWIVKNYNQYRRSIANLNEASIGPGGELIDFDNRFEYPYDEIWKSIKDYVRENEKTWMQFGWIISDSDFPTDKYKSYGDFGTFFRVEKIDDFAGGWDVPILDILDSDEKAWEKAEKAGFILDEDGIIIGFDGVNFVDQLNENFKVGKNLITEESNRQIDEAIRILMESDVLSPTFEWDIAKEKIDNSKKHIKTRDQAQEYLSGFFGKIKNLPKSVKLRLAKYVATSLVGLAGLNAISGIVSKELPEMKNDVLMSINNYVENPKKQEIKSTPTKSSSELVDFLKYEEGSVKSKGEPVLTAYSIGDGMITIGWGHAERVSDSNFRVGESITEERAEQLLAKDIKEAEDGLNRILNDWKKDSINVEIDQHMYDAMTSMIFNMGIGNFRKSEFIQLVKQGKYEEAKDRLLTTAVSYPGHVTRRQKESEMFWKGMASDNLAFNDSKYEIREFVRKSLSEYFDIT